MNAEADRDAFRRHVAASDGHVHAGDADAANKEVSAIEALAQAWDQQGQLVAFLSPLLDPAESDSVRFNAAACLLGAGQQEVAVPALEELRDNTTGIASTDAKLLLRYWERQQTSS